MGQANTDLKGFGAQRLRGAVEEAIRAATGPSRGHLPSQERLEQGAKATLEQRDEPSSAYFQSILEVAYLVASADGFADDERSALALLLEGVTGRAVGRDSLELHLRDLGEASGILGRRERLRRAAEDFDDEASRVEALGFAALVALADGELTGPETEALVELGGHLGMARDRVTEVVEGVVGSVRAVLES
jgi:tellurite resistance protein